MLALKPCNSGLRFAEQCGFDTTKIYNTCHRGDWLIWWLRKTGAINKPQAVKLAIMCAERVLVIYEKERPGDLRPRRAIESAKTWIGNPTEENRHASAASAYATDAAASAAAYAASATYASAAYAAASATYAAASADATDAAAATAAAAYAAAAAIAAATPAASKKESQWQADKIREIVPCPFDTDHPDHSACQLMAQVIG